MTGAFEEIGYRRTSVTATEGGCAHCGRPKPPRCVFCPDCHFALPPAYARAALRAQIACERAVPGAAAEQARATFRSTIRSCLNALSHEGQP